MVTIQLHTTLNAVSNWVQYITILGNCRNYICSTYEDVDANTR